MTTITPDRPDAGNIARVLQEVIPVDTLNCVTCQQLLAHNFVMPSCGHRACTDCWTRQQEHSSRARCAICRVESNNAKPDQLAIDILKYYPRTMRCGQVVYGIDAITPHDDNCRNCWKIVRQDERKFMSALKFACNNKDITIQNLRDELDAARQEYIHKIGTYRRDLEHLQEENARLKNNIEIDVDVDIECIDM